MSHNERAALEVIVRDLEENLAGLLRLDVGASIDKRRKFASLGLDSLLAIDLLAALETRYGSLPETVLRDHPTIQQLADFLYSYNKDASD
jgi:rhizoxin synthesis polyketide synthase/nonribosomal peptide synthetase RhiB